MKIKIFFLLITFSFLINMVIFADSSNEITNQCSISSLRDISLLIDGKYTTCYKAAKGEVIDIKSDVAIKSIYILWDKLPNEWYITEYQDKNKLVSFYNNKDNIFMHQLIEVKNNTKSFSLFINSGDCKIAEIYVFGDGKLPDWVQKWDNPYIKADMLLLSTHADDEHLFFGGTMPYYAGELGLKVQVAYLTNHYNYRIHELLNGLWTVGIKAYPIISQFPDKFASTLDEAKKLYDENKIIEYQVGLLRRFRPNVVVGHDLNGEYGHGVHMLNAHCLAKALEISIDPIVYEESAKKYGVWNVAKCYLHLYKENKISMNWDIPLKKFSGKTAFDMAIEGFSKHISQLEYFSVSKNGVMDCRAFGLYRSTVGLDKNKNDFFENINLRKNNPIRYRNSFVL